MILNFFAEAEAIEPRNHSEYGPRHWDLHRRPSPVLCPRFSVFYNASIL